MSSLASASIGSLTHKPVSSLLCDDTVYYQIFLGDSITKDTVNSGDGCGYRRYLQDLEGIDCWGYLGSYGGCTIPGYDGSNISNNGWTTTDIKTAFEAEVDGILPEGADESNFWVVEYGGANDWAGCIPNFNTVCSDEDMNLIADRKIATVQVGITRYPSAKGMVVYPTAYGSASNGSMKSVNAFPPLMDAKIDTAQAGGMDVIGCNLHGFFTANGCQYGNSVCFDDHTHLSEVGEELAAEGIQECKTNCDNFEYCNN